MEWVLAVVALLGWAGLAMTVAARTRVERHLSEAVAAVAARLGADQPPSPDDLARTVARVDRAATGALEKVASAERLSDALAAVLGEIPLGVVVSDQAGEVLFRNSAADRLLGTR
ncbi:MAG: hypothetical protein ACRD0S_04080, partial [Acidimicrobiales bacterium]